MPSSSILLFETDPASEEIIGGVLKQVGYSVTPVADAEAVFLKAPDNHLIIIDLVTGQRTAAEMCREIRQTPALAAIPVLCISQSDEVEERIAFLEAGADDVMAKPFDARELEARVEALLLRFQRSRELAPLVSGDGLRPGSSHRLVGLFSPKGGVGTTTIAVNIATAVAERRPDRTLIIDLDLQFGQVATHLDLTVKQTLADVARDEMALNEPELLRSYAARHETGLHVLAAPGSPELADLVQPKTVEQLLATAREAYDSVIVDAGSGLDERSMQLFSLADTVIVPLYPELAALKAVHSLLDYLNEVGSVSAKTAFVLNNLFAKGILRLRDIEGALGAKVSAELPYDAFLYQKAVNEGVPVVRGAAKSAPAESLVKLATAMFGEDDGATAVVHEERRRLLGGLLKGPKPAR